MTPRYLKELETKLTPEAVQYVHSVLADPIFLGRQKRACDKLGIPYDRLKDWRKTKQFKKYWRAMNAAAIDRAARATSPKALQEAEARLRSTGVVVMSEAELILRMSAIGRADMGDFVSLRPARDVVTGEPKKTPEGAPEFEPFLDWEKAVRLGRTHLVKRVSVRGGEFHVELLDPQRAQETLAKVYGLLDGDQDEQRRKMLREAHGVWLEILKQLPQESLLNLHRAMLARAPIEVQAQRNGNDDGNPAAA